MPQNSSCTVPIQGWTSGNTAQVNFKDIPLEGPVELMKLQIGLNMISTTTSAFALSVGTGLSVVGEGTDDIDIIMGTIVAGNWLLNITPDEETFSQVASQVRTLFMILNTRDYSGTLVNNPVNVPASSGSSQAYYIEINIPVGLTEYCPNWGNVFTMGTKAMDGGNMQMLLGNLTATMTLAHGSATLSNVVPKMTAIFGHGESGDVGLRWIARRSTATLQFTPEKGAVPLAFCSTTAPAATNPEFYNWVFSRNTIDPNTLADEMRRQRGTIGNFSDWSNRVTPLDWRDPAQSFSNLVAAKTQRNSMSIQNASSSTLNYLQVLGKPGGPAAIQRVSQEMAKGGAVNIRKKTPLGVPAGMRVPDILTDCLPDQIRPGPAKSGTRVAANASNPTAAARGRAKELARVDRKTRRIDYILGQG